MTEKNRSHLKIVLWILGVIAAFVLIFWEVLFFRPKPGFEAHVQKDLPVVSLVNTDGQAQALSQILSESKKSKAIVSMWATWCAPCVHELPHIASQRERLERDDTALILVNYDGGSPSKTMAEVSAWLAANKIDLTTYYDFNEALIKGLQVDGLPFTMGIGKDRKIQWAQLGELDWSGGKIRVD